MSTKPDDRTAVLAGGCQCGAIRYALYAEPSNPHICHCRMCQKALGNYFAPFAGVKGADFAWTRGTPAIFRSSEVVERGFCRDCGTPLSFRYTTRDGIGVTLGSLDEPSRIVPAWQFGIESRIAFFDELHRLEGQTTQASLRPDIKGRLASRQHPDRET
jgi:hypothetical protein